MIRAVFDVQRARWLRSQPGRTGIIAALLCPLLFLLPFHSAGLFSHWSEAAGAVALFLPIVLAAALTRDSSRPAPSAIWLYQKGVPLDDWVLVRWMLDTALAVALSLLLIPGIIAGAWLWTSTVQIGFAFRVVTGGISVGLAAAAFLFAVGTTGSTRGVDFLILVVLLGLLEPLFGTLLDPVVGAVLHWTLLPVGDAASIPGGLARHEWSAAAHAAFHVAIWWTLLIAFGILQLHRWRPTTAAAG